MDNEITKYGGLVRSIARRYPLPPGWERSDLEQEGYIGLVNAMRRYDPDGLHRTYARETVYTFGIKTAIRKALRAELGTVPDETPDISEQPTIVLAPSSVSPVITPAWLNSRVTRPLLVVPLEYPDPAPSVEEQVTAAVDGAQVSATLEAALLLLTAHQRSIIEHRFGLGGDRHEWTLEEIGKLLGRHRSNIYRQQVKALAVLRASLSKSRDGQLILHRFEEKRAARARKRAA